MIFARLLVFPTQRHYGRVLTKKSLVFFRKNNQPRNGGNFAISFYFVLYSLFSDYGLRCDSKWVRLQSKIMEEISRRELAVLKLISLFFKYIIRIINSLFEV